MNGERAFPVARVERGDHPSLRAAAGEAIRNHILEGRVKPGEALSVKNLQLQSGIGTSAIREALCQLAADGLVIAEDQRGFRVAPISLHDLESVTEARVEIEVWTIRSAIAHTTTDDEAALIAAYHRLRKADGATAVYAAQHDAFHELLVAPCPNDWMKRFRMTLQRQSERYRALAVSYSETPRDILAEHGALVDAIVARDADLAVALITKHVRETASRVLDARIAAS